jgi:PKD repeat protein
MTGKNIDKIEILNKDNVLVFNNNIMKIFNISKSKFLNKEYIVKGKNINDDVIYVYLSDDKKLLSVAYYSNNMKFYKTSEVFKNFINTNSNNNSNNMVLQENKKIVEKVTQQVVKPKVIIKKIIVEKKVKDTENKKPTLTIYASKIEGETPLTVNFKFLANDEDGKIASYYVNFAGQEIMHKGNPTKSFNYTFKNAGKYKIIVAVKDNKGAITTKQVTITVKPKHEESFQDYKRSLMGQ